MTCLRPLTSGKVLFAGLSSDFNIKILDGPNCDVIKIGIVAELLPVGVSEVMTQKLCDDVKSYKEAKDVIARFMAFKDDTGPAPMDCSYVNGYSWDAWTQPENPEDDVNIEELHAFQKGKSKGKGKSGYWTCGDLNHHAHECPILGQGQGKGRKGAWS